MSSTRCAVPSNRTREDEDALKEYELPQQIHHSFNPMEFFREIGSTLTSIKMWDEFLGVRR